MRVFLQIDLRRVFCPRCGKVKTERLDWLITTPYATKRFAYHVGRLCREMTVKTVAEELHLDWDTVKNLDKQYMEAQLKRFRRAPSEALGVDEVCIRKRRVYRVVVSDLLRGRPIWFGGKGRREEDLDEYFKTLTERQKKRIRVVVMDMWTPFFQSVRKNVPQAVVIFDKFHIMMHLHNALDEVRRSEYKRVSEKDRSFIKGQRYTLLSHRENLTLTGKQALRKLFAANRRLNKAYLLKESFGQLWDYQREGWARVFFEKWKEQLKWQRLKPYEKFVKMVGAHWEGIAAYCHPENKVPLGMVEGINNKIRVIQRRAYGFRDEEYLRLKILTAFLPRL